MASKKIKSQIYMRRQSLLLLLLLLLTSKSEAQKSEKCTK
jgi:hypothetical protein